MINGLNYDWLESIGKGQIEKVLRALNQIGMGCIGNKRVNQIFLKSITSSNF